MDRQTLRRSWLHRTVLAAALSIAGAAGPSPDVTINRLPRPVARTPGAERVAKALAQMDAQFRKDAADCRATPQHMDFEFQVGARRLLETATIYSVEYTMSYYCGGPHPESGASAVTFDLRTGTPYDLNRAFHVEDEGHLSPAAVPLVTQYWPNKQCESEDFFADTLKTAWVTLGVTRQYLIFYFEVPHAEAVCFKPAQVPLQALSGVADRAELKRLGRPFEGH